MVVHQFIQPDDKEYQESVLLAFCEGIPPVISGFLSQMANDANSVSMSCRPHVLATWWTNERANVARTWEDFMIYEHTIILLQELILLP